MSSFSSSFSTNSPTVSSLPSRIAWPVLAERSGGPHRATRIRSPSIPKLSMRPFKRPGNDRPPRNLKTAMPFGPGLREPSRHLRACLRPVTKSLYRPSEDAFTAYPHCYRYSYYTPARLSHGGSILCSSCLSLCRSCSLSLSPTESNVDGHPFFLSKYKR
jgi:hypothetical protein